MFCPFKLKNHSVPKNTRNIPNKSYSGNNNNNEIPTTLQTEHAQHEPRINPTQKLSWFSRRRSNANIKKLASIRKYQGNVTTRSEKFKTPRNLSTSVYEALQRIKQDESIAKVRLRNEYEHYGNGNNKKEQNQEDQKNKELGNDVMPTANIIEI